MDGSPYVAPIPLRQDFDAWQPAAWQRRRKTALRPGGSWLLRAFMTVQCAPTIRTASVRGRGGSIWHDRDERGYHSERARLASEFGIRPDTNWGNQCLELDKIGFEKKPVAQI